MSNLDWHQKLKLKVSRIFACLDRTCLKPADCIASDSTTKPEAYSTDSVSCRRLRPSDRWTRMHRRVSVTTTSTRMSSSTTTRHSRRTTSEVSIRHRARSCISLLDSQEPRDPRPPYVQFRVGQVIRHKVHGYRAVIVGWDEKARAPEWWLEKVHKGRKVRRYPIFM